MSRLIVTFGLMLVLASGAAHAACDSEQAMNKASGVSEILSDKVQTKPDEASRLMSEIGEIMNTGTVTDQTCSRLDALTLRAKGL